MTVQATSLASPVTPPRDQLAAFLKAAADPLRLDILQVLAHNSYGVLELARIFAVGQSGMSHHLKLLSAAGLTTSRREGNSVYYRRAMLVTESPVAALQQTLYQAVDTLSLPPTVSKHLQAIAAERAQASRDFFALNVHKFRAQQDLIASYPVYGEQVAQLLAHSPLRSTRLAVEVGPGEGEFLPVLAQHFNRVIALDNAEGMLERSRQLVADHKLKAVECVLGDTHWLVREQIQADCIVINMVLHHTPSPAEIFQHLSDALAPGGVLLVTDLCRHEQDWARKTCGDIWQGFEPQEFSQWAANAGLDEGQSLYTALRNGFQVQDRQFFKPD